MKRTWMLPAAFVTLLVLGLQVPHAEETKASPMQQLYLMKELVPGLTTVGLIWNESAVDKAAILPKIERASASLGVQVVIANAEALKDISTEFKKLTGNHHIQVLWVVEDDNVVSSAVGQKFLIQNSVISKIPLIAPTVDWVSKGACLTMQKVAGKTKLVVNPQTAKALSIQLPEKYAPNTEFFAQK